MPDCPPARECEGREGPSNDTASAQVGRHTTAGCQHCAKGHSQTHSCQSQLCCHSGRSEGVESSESSCSKNNISNKSNTESTSTLNSKLLHNVHLEAHGGRRCRSTHHLNRAPYPGVPCWLWSPGSSVATILTLTLLTLLQLVPWSAAIVYRKQMSGRVITTRYGKVRGILVEFPNRHLKPVEAFFGLKYADLEKGNMRFMPPKNPKEQWTKIRAAIAQQPSCPQLMRHERDYQNAVPEGRVTHLRNITPFLTEQIEDCLTLNLYVPIPSKCMRPVRGVRAYRLYRRVLRLPVSGVRFSSVCHVSVFHRPLSGSVCLSGVCVSPFSVCMGLSVTCLCFIVLCLGLSVC